MDMFTKNEIILMIGVVSVLLICIIILTILDIKEYLKNKKALLEEVSFGEEFSEDEKPLESKIEVEERKDEVTPDEILVSDVKDDDILLEEMGDEEFNVKVTPTVKEVVVPKVEVLGNEVKKDKKRLEIFEDLDEIENNLPNKKDDITNFEMEQERTAIISLDELTKRSNELYDSNEVMQYDDGDEPISIDEVMAKFNRENNIVEAEEKQIPEVMRDIVVETKEAYSKKETIPFISSVYGIEKENNALEFENTATYEKLDRQNYNDFVAKLREMNENK